MNEYLARTFSGGASAISEGDIFIYSCSAQLISFEIESTSKEINCAEHEYLNMPPPTLIALATLLRTYAESHELFEFMHLNTNIVKHLGTVYATNNIILLEMHAFATPRLPSMQLYFPNMKYLYRLLSLQRGNFYSF